MTKPHEILIKDIIIPEDHWDRDGSNTDNLLESIEKHGIIQPIVITDKKELVAGFRRLTFALELQMEKVPVHYIGELSTLERKTLELEENIRRKDLSWSEKDKQTAELHELKVTIHGERAKGHHENEEEREGWGLQETADTINETKGNISRSIKLSEEIKKDPELANASSRSAALATIKRREMQEIRRILADRDSEVTKDIIIEGEADKLIKSIPSETVGLIITDIPYNANIEEEAYANSQGRMSFEQTSFDDDKENINYTEYVKGLREEFFRILLPGSHIWMFCGFDQVVPLREHFAEKFYVRKLPIIWNKMTRGYSPVPEVQIPRNYECILFMSKGSKQFNLDSYFGANDKWCDILECRKVSSQHKRGINEKPSALIWWLMELSSEENDLVLDPFCGTGVTPSVAIEHKRRALAFDNNPEALVIANERVGESLRFASGQKTDNTYTEAYLESLDEGDE